MIIGGIVSNGTGRKARVSAVSVRACHDEVRVESNRAKLTLFAAIFEAPIVLPLLS